MTGDIELDLEIIEVVKRRCPGAFQCEATHVATATVSLARVLAGIFASVAIQRGQATAVAIAEGTTRRMMNFADEVRDEAQARIRKESH